MSDLNELSDGEIIRLAEQLGIEKSVVRDGEGGLVDRDEIIEYIESLEE